MHQKAKVLAMATSSAGRQSGASAAERIHNRKAQELVIGFCGYIGSGISTVANKFQKLFQDNYSYTANIIKISKIIADNLTMPDCVNTGERIKALQALGLRMRTSEGTDALAARAIETIKQNRAEARHEKFGDGDMARAVSDDSKDNEIRIVSIIDNIKHADELNLLRAVYGDMFFLVGVICPEDERLNRLTINKHISQSGAYEIIERDREDSDGNGVQVAKVLCESDFFISNTKDNIQSIEPNITRFIDLILGVGTHTPTISEYAMSCAQVSAVRSACISKQVGAAIMTATGEIISLGRNDVPKFGGGLYTCDDKTDDNRCAFRYDGKCKNSEHKDDIVLEIASSLKQLLGDEKAQEAAQIVASSNKIKGLTEFSRSIHAEMDAITSAARLNSHQLHGGILYTTTFPCHNCARHIVACGIKQVFYIEPYDKSLAFELHDDAIRIDKPEGDCEGYLRINQFEGVAPRVFLSLFSAGERKKYGSVIQVDPRKAKPKRFKQLDKFQEYEDVAIDQFKEASAGTVVSSEPDPGAPEPDPGA